MKFDVSFYFDDDKNQLMLLTLHRANHNTFNKVFL